MPIHLTVDAHLLVAASGKAVVSLKSREQELCYIQLAKYECGAIVGLALHERFDILPPPGLV